MDAVAATLQHLIFDRFFLDSDIYDITGIVYLQVVGTAIPMWAVLTVFRIDSFNTIRFVQYNVVSFTSGLTTNLFPAFPA